MRLSSRCWQSPHIWIALLATLALVTLAGMEDAASQPSLCTRPDSTLEPVFCPPGGYYDRSILLRIACPSPVTGEHGTVIFTTDGSVPTHTNGAAYDHPIRLSAAAPAVTVVRARRVLPNGSLGPVASASYFVGVEATLPLLSLIADPKDLWDPVRGIEANPLERGKAWERPVDITYVDEKRRTGFHVPAGIRIHGGGSRKSSKHALRLYFRREYGLGRLEYPLFAHSAVQSFDQLVLHNGGQDWSNPQRESESNWTMLRNQLTDRLARQLGGYASYSQPVLVFINGEPWGIYHIRERLNEDFLADHYGIESTDFIKAPEVVPDQTILAGDTSHWDHLLQFAETRDLADPANYTYVQTQVDIPNLIDYYVLQIYAANGDWPHHNVRQFRPRVQGGRWQWVFWDTDNGYGALPVPPGSRVDSNLIAHLLEHDHPKTGGRDVILIRRLLENPVFLGQFLGRAADLLNSTLAPHSVIAHIDALAAELAPDIAHEKARWSSSSALDWASSVQELRDFARLRPDSVRRHMVEGFGLNGIGRLTVNPAAEGSGSVAISGSLLPGLPWQGSYFQDVPIALTAVPAPGYRFAAWQPAHLPQQPVITLTIDAGQSITPCFEMVDEAAPRPGDVVFAGFYAGKRSQAEEDWLELLVLRPGGIDLRGWRITDNDTKTASDEGSLVFSRNPALAHVPEGTTIRIVVRPTDSSPGTTDTVMAGDQDDLRPWDGHMVLHAGDGDLDTTTDPGFDLGPNDSLALLAPGSTASFADDQGIALAAAGTSVTPASFGVLADGVVGSGGTRE